MRRIELVMDIGSSNITVFKKDSGIVLKEPTIVAVATNGNKTEFTASGSEVKAKLVAGENVQVVYPIREGVIDHEKGAIYLFRRIFEKVAGKGRIFAPNISVIAAVSCGLENAEKKDIEKALREAGATSVIIVDSPLAVKMKCQDDNCFIVDIGASKTEIAFVTPNGIVAGCSMDIGGDELTRVISDYIMDTYRATVQMSSIEKLKTKIATMFDNDASVATVNGKSIIDSKPQNVRISSKELMQAMSIVFDNICNAVNITKMNVVAMSDKYGEDIMNNGIYLCGGVANIPGIETYMTNKIGVKVIREAEPENAVVEGGSEFFYNKAMLANMLNIKNLR